MRKSVRTIIAKWLIVLALLVFTVTLTLSHYRHPNLLHVASPIADASSRIGQLYVTGWTSQYYWASESEFVTLGDTRFQARSVMHSVMRTDIRTGHRTAMPSLAKALDKNTDKKEVSNFWPSSDGRWILIESNSFRAISTDRRKTITWQCPAEEESGGSNLRWLSGSDRWVLLSNSGNSATVFVHSLEHPGTPERLPVSNSGNNPDEEAWFLMTAGSNNLVVEHNDLKHRPEWGRIDLGAHTATISRLALPLAEDEDLREIVASPDGQSLAYTVWVKGSQQNTGWLAWLRRRLGANVEDAMALRICDAKGDMVREIGCIPVDVMHISDLGTISDVPIGPQRLAWTPSGRHLSFVFREKLWLVSTPQ